MHREGLAANGEHERFFFSLPVINDLAAMTADAIFGQPFRGVLRTGIKITQLGGASRVDLPNRWRMGLADDNRENKGENDAKNPKPLTHPGTPLPEGTDATLALYSQQGQSRPNNGLLGCYFPE
jgi:hypothetical protein